MEELIEQLIKDGYLKTSLIIEAFKKIKREDFVTDDLKNEADINAPLPIGHGQTISQPLTVAFMLELLQPEPGEKILDIGAGSGWQTALLAYCVGSPSADGGKVIAIELIPELAEFGTKNIAKYNFIEKGIVEVICGDGSRGLEKEAPFDKIIAAASATREPEELKNQLKIGGKLVIPIKESIWLFVRKDSDNFEEQEFPGFAFVPLIGG
jgi:protein-L-isoaspartate(D-aspartate) O-methyltransferase